MSSQPHPDIFIPCKPIAGQMVPMGHGEATAAATCVWLINGDHDAAVIGACLAPTDFGAVVTLVRATGRTLRTMYITHGHGRYFFPGQIPGRPPVPVVETTVVNQAHAESRLDCQLADAMMAAPGDPGKPLQRCRQPQGRLRAGTNKHRHEHADDPAGNQCGRNRGTGRKVSQVAGVRELTSGGYLVQVSETELALIKTALEQTGRVSRFGMEVLEEADHFSHARRVKNTRLRGEIEALAIREASLRSLQETMAEAELAEEVA